MRALGAYAVWIVLAICAGIIIRSRHQRAATWQPFGLSAVAAVSLWAFVVVDWGRATPFGDFNKAYYAAGSRILTDPSTLYACEVSNLCFVNLPIVAVVFTPLVVLGRAGAQVAFTILGLSAVVLAAAIVIRELRADGASRYTIVALFALNGPLLYSLRLGNVSHVLLPLLAFAVIWLSRGRELRAGIALAVLAVNKLPFLLFLAYLVVRRRWIAAAAFAGTFSVMLIASITLFGAALHGEWLRGFVGPFARWPIGAYNVQSISGLLAHYLMPGHLTDWVPLAPPFRFTVLRYGMLLAVASLVGLTLLRSGIPRNPREYSLEQYIMLLLALVASPLTWTHYYAFVLVPLAAMIGGHVPAGGQRWRFVVVLATILVSLPVVLPRVPHPLAAALIERVLISHYTWGALLLLVALCLSRLNGSPQASIFSRSAQHPEEHGLRDGPK